MSMYKVNDPIDVTITRPSIVLGVGMVTKRYSGVVVKLPHWVEYDAVAIRTGHVDFPISIIPTSWIVGVEKSLDTFMQVHEVVSGANTYTVTVRSGNVHCSCVGFQFRKYCKHSNPFKKS